MRKEKVILLALLIIGQIFIFPINVNPVFGSEPYELKRKIQVPTNAVSYVKLSQQGNSVLAGPAVPVSKTEVILYNANTGKGLAKFPAGNELSSIDFSSNGNYVATFRENRLQVYDTRQGNVVFKRDSLISTSKLSFGPENEKLAFSACLKKEEGKKCEESEVRVLDLKDNETRVLAKSKEKVYSVNWGNKNFIACVLSDPSAHQVIKFYNSESGKPIGRVKSIYSPVSFFGSGTTTRPEVSFGDKDRLFAATSIGGVTAKSGKRTVLVWKMSTGELLTRIELTKEITSIEISRKNDILAISTVDGNISFWEIKNGRKLYSYKAHDSPVLEIDLSSNGKVLATGSENNTVKIWKLELDRIAKGIHPGESKDSQEAHSTTLPDGITEASKRDVQYSSGIFPVHFDNDNRRELVIVSNKNENSFVKIFPLNEEKLPYSMIIDRYDSSNPFESTDPNINILSTNVRQTDHNSVTFTMNLVESPELIPDKTNNELQNEDKYLEYIWKILAGQNIDENNNGYSYTEYYIRVTGDGKNWNVILENKANGNTSPIKEFKMVGNELEVQVELNRLGSPSFLRYSAVARSPEKGKADIFEDKTSPPLMPEINLFDQKPLPPEQSRPGELLISPEFNSDENTAITKVYRINALIEELKREEKIPTTFTLITKEGKEYLFEFSKGRVEISKG